MQRKPRSFASRTVVFTHTSVVTPQTRSVSIDRLVNVSSRSVRQNAPLPGLSMTGSPAMG